MSEATYVAAISPFGRSIPGSSLYLFAWRRLCSTLPFILLDTRFIVLAYCSSTSQKGDGVAPKGGAARAKQSQAGKGGGRVVRGVHGESAPSPRTSATRAQPDTVQGGKRKRKGAVSG